MPLRFMKSFLKCYKRMFKKSEENGYKEVRGKLLLQELSIKNFAIIDEFRSLLKRA